MLPCADPRPKPKRHLDQFSHFCTAHCTVSLYFTMGRPYLPSKLPLPMADLDPIPYMAPWAHQSPQHKHHLDWFSRFAGLTTVTDRLTDTDRPRYSVCNNRPHQRFNVYSTAMRPKMSFWPGFVPDPLTAFHRLHGWS